MAEETDSKPVQCEFESHLGYLKFTEEKLFQLHRIAKEINKLDIGVFSLPERFGIFDDKGNAIAIMIWNDRKYDLELVADDMQELHRQEVGSTEEVKEK